LGAGRGIWRKKVEAFLQHNLKSTVSSMKKIETAFGKEEAGELCSVF